MSSAKRGSLFFIPFPIISHLVAAVKEAELLAERDHTLEVTILVIKLPVETNISLSSYINNSSSNSPVKFIEISPKEGAKPTEIGPAFIIKFIESLKPAVRDTVGEILARRETNSPAGFVIDMFCTPMIDVADELGIPAYVFFTCGAAVLGLMFRIHALGEVDGFLKYKNSTEPVMIPGYKHPVPPTVWPEIVFHEQMETMFFEMIRGFRRTRGILGNTFLDFESYAIQGLWDDRELPPFYPVGPILQNGPDEAERSKPQYSEIISWLDEQPDSSVVFLCFGSNGAFPEDQVKEIAAGLELSGHRFLWALRRPPPEGQVGFPTEYENHRDVLPEGFLDRTQGRGKVIGWAPQIAVLDHPAVGGFVSHCGWNSTLESVWFGVPLATWPLGAEQQANAFQLVKEFEMAVEIKIDYRRSDGVVIPAEKIGTAIIELMDLENPIRVKVKDLKDKSRKALLKQEPSDHFLGRFIDDFLTLSTS